jgi:Flp pilus assembly protein TadG
MVTAFVVIFSVALVFMVGLVFDGGRMLAAHRQARDVADAAARAGAQGLSEVAVKNGDDIVLDPDDAAGLACTFLDKTAFKCGDAEITVDGNEVIVEVHGSVGMEFLPGAAASVSAEGRACVAIGIAEQTNTDTC